jgi:hypothetical protein
MRDTRISALAAGLLCVAAGLGGCGGGPSVSGFAAASVADAGGSVGASEQDAVRRAARQMTGETDARVHGLVARIAPGDEGLDICGWVDTAGDASVPLYVELREVDGRITAQRGQVGATPDKLAKVRFMCRGHEGW